MKTLVGFRKKVLSVALCVCCRCVFAQDLGVVGPVYPIAEQDMLVTIGNRLKALEENGGLERIEEESKARYQSYAERLTGVALPRATRNRTYYVDPSITIPYDIKDSQGRLLYPAGTTVNPLEHMNLSKKLIFFDGDDPAQVEWTRSILKQNPAQIKLILTNGPVMKLMKEWQARLYFDQRNRLASRFGIQGVPAVVSQDGSRLKVVEHNLNNRD
ncbi:MAG: type-F conjugative transfer system protein TraW [Gammaproteobacteria bacterium]|nr:type-F conjugative transfer system protein TraW [Gammaproteobacteria bacterium]